MCAIIATSQGTRFRRRSFPASRLLNAAQQERVFVLSGGNTVRTGPGSCGVSGLSTSSDAFECFVLPEIELLLRVAGSLTRNSADAEDLVQDTLLRAFRSIDSFVVSTASMVATPGPGCSLFYGTHTSTGTVVAARSCCESHKPRPRSLPRPVTHLMPAWRPCSMSRSTVPCGLCLNRSVA